MDLNLGKALSLSDAQLSSGVFLLHLCDAVAPGVVAWDVASAGTTPEEKEMNAKYVLSGMGRHVFAGDDLGVCDMAYVLLLNMCVWTAAEVSATI